MKPENQWSHVLAHRSEAEEYANALTHALGFLLSVIGAIAMTIWVLREGDGWRIAACMLYTLCLVGVYAMSTMSHFCQDPFQKIWYRRLDQGFIYLLIVSTYTPFSLAFLRTTPWWIFLGAMWTVAIFGFVSKVFLAHRVNAVSVWIYVLLGWMPIVAGPALIGLVADAALWWMLIGGLCYTVGTVFLLLDNRVRHFHATWHMFVIAGSACHFFAILIFVAPVT